MVEMLSNWELAVAFEDESQNVAIILLHRAKIYMQNMGMMQETHPDVYQHFQDGLHVMMRRDRYWTGLSPDFAIEQVLMSIVKST
jgi:hypothetical protein